MLRFILAGSLLAGCLVSFAPPGRAQQGPVALTPARVPAPALRHALLPKLRDQAPGDAGPHYRKANELLLTLPPAGDERQRLHQLIDNLQNPALPDLPRDQVRQVLQIYKGVIDQLEQAARCEGCDWGMTDPLRKRGFRHGFYNEVGQLRLAGQLLCLRARLELLDDRPDQALRTLRTAYVLAHRLGNTPWLGSYANAEELVGYINARLFEVMGHPKTPNLYWSLTDLPRPFLDVRKPLEGLRLQIYGMFPGLEAIATRRDAKLPADQLDTTVEFLARLRPRDVIPPLSRVALAGAIQRQHETAKKVLLEQGWPRDWVESMPQLHAALLHGLADFDEGLDELRRWEGVPYWQARPALEALEQKQREERRRPPADSPAVPMNHFLPQPAQVYGPQVRVERQFAALRCLEALRLYAAHHEGKLPASLGEIKEVPIPIDPETGQPFEYRLHEGQATLETPSVPGKGTNFLRYEVTIRR
jgi:hypothetical protein